MGTARLKRTLLGFVFVATCASAAPLCTTKVSTAADFQAQGHTGCQFGDKVFYDFSYSYTRQDSNGNSLPSNVAASAVSIQFSNLGNNPLMPVVSFLANWDVINGEQGDVRITYNVQAPLANAMYFSSLTLEGYVSNVDPDNQFTSYISGAESVCCPRPGNTVASLGVELDPPLITSGLVFQTGYNSVTYPAATQISISKDIFLSAGSNSGVPGGPPNGNEARLTRIDQGLAELTSIPEPFSFVLFGSGLVILGLRAKRSVKSDDTRRA